MCEEVPIPEVELLVAEELVVVEGIKGVIDVPMFITILGSNECHMDGVEASEACMRLNN